MAVQDFECQIARAQIGRYLQGDALSSEALDQLEDHIAECPGCKGVLTERRKALQEMLGWKGEEAPKTAVIQEPPSTAPKNLQNKAIAQLQQAMTSTKTGDGKKPTVWKPLALSAGLAVVLIGMSYMTKGSNSILGERVTEALPPAPAAIATAPIEPDIELGVGDNSGLSPASTVAPIVTISDEQLSTEPIAEQPDDSAALPVAGEVKQAEPPKPTTVSKSAEAPAKPVVKKAPQVEVKKATPRSVTTQPAPAKPKQQPRTNTIRVYDENGNPIR